MESLEIMDMVKDELEYKGLPEKMGDEAIRYIKDSSRLMEMLDLIVSEAISAVSE